MPTMPGRDTYETKSPTPGTNLFGRALFSRLLFVCILLACAAFTGCGGSSTSSTGKGTTPTITSFAANPTGISPGSNSTELGHDRCREHRDHARYIYFHIRKRFHKRQPDSNNRLHAYGNGHCRVGHCNRDRHCKYWRKQARHQLLHRKSDEHHFRVCLYSELDDDGSDESRDHARCIHFHVCNRLYERQSNDGDHLYFNCLQQRRIDNGDRKNFRDRFRRNADHRNNILPWWNARQGIHGLRHRRQWRISAIHVFHQHEFQFSPIARRDVS